MPDITFIYPKGAFLEVSPDWPDGIDGFKDNCLWDGKVICDWALLESYLITGDVERYWWYLTTPERFSITEKAVENTLFYPIHQFGHGDANCAGGDIDWIAAECGPNAAIRALKFSPPMTSLHPYDPVDHCYYTYPDERCFIPDTTYNLPCHWASWDTADITHSMCAIQINEDKSMIGSWYIFQYHDANIQYGNTQMSGPGTLSIGKIDRIACGGCNYTTVATFKF